MNMNWLCFFGFHKWGKWENMDDPQKSVYIMQVRYCARCGKIKQRIE